VFLEHYSLSEKQYSPNGIACMGKPYSVCIGSNEVVCHCNGRRLDTVPTSALEGLQLTHAVNATSERCISTL